MIWFDDNFFRGWYGFRKYWGSICELIQGGMTVNAFVGLQKCSKVSNNVNKNIIKILEYYNILRKL